MDIKNEAIKNSTDPTLGPGTGFFPSFDTSGKMIDTIGINMFIAQGFLIPTQLASQGK